MGGGRAVCVCVCGCLALVFRLGWAALGLAGWLAGWRALEGARGDWLAGSGTGCVMSSPACSSSGSTAPFVPRRWHFQSVHGSSSTRPGMPRGPGLPALDGPKGAHARPHVCSFVRSCRSARRIRQDSSPQVPVKVKVRSSSTQQCAHSHARGSQLTPNAPASDEIGSIRAGPFLPLVESTGRVGWVRGTYVHMVVIYPGMLP